MISSSFPRSICKQFSYMPYKVRDFKKQMWFRFTLSVEKESECARANKLDLGVLGSFAEFGELETGFSSPVFRVGGLKFVISESLR